MSADPANQTNHFDLVPHDTASVLTHAYRPFERARDLVQALLDALVARKPFIAAEAHLIADGCRVRASSSTRLSAIARDDWPASVPPLPLVCQRQTFGELFVLAETAHGSDRNHQFLQDFARVVSLLLQRYEVRRHARTRLGYDLWFVGLAPGLRLLEDRLEQVAVLSLPVLIHGEFGCEARAVAFAAHVASRPAEPFRELRCSEATAHTSFTASLDRLHGELEHGTLFLSDVDELDPQCQRQLIEFLGPSTAPQLSLRFDSRERSPAPFRVIASTSRSLGQLSEHGAFSRSLWAALDYLRLRIPPLRERREDIPYLIEYFAGMYSQRDRAWFSPEATAILSAWHWPGNLIELERTLARLMVTTHTGLIDTDHLREWAAELLPNAPDPVYTSATDGLERAGPDEETNVANAVPQPPPLALARQLLAGRFDDIDAFHPGLQRALRCLAERFHEEIALERLARESFVSPSYLCALFKKSIGMGFKRFQSILRVEKAKELLIHHRHNRITDISLEVGFGDFSHFLKTFKRFTHISPREFRKQQMGANGIERSV